MLTGQKEWIVVGALALYIAFVPTPAVLKDLFSSPVGKLLAVAAGVYLWKNVSQIVAVLVLVAFLRSGALREYLDPETGVTPSTSTDNNFKCPDEFIYDAGKKMCTKGTETKSPECTDAGATWSSASGKCESTKEEAQSAGGPPGGTTPGSMAAKNDLKNATTTGAPPTEHFTPYTDRKDDKFAPA